MLSKIFFTLLFAFLFCIANAQDHKLDSIAENLARHDLSTRHSTLFVHFDKNVYTNNDQVWFTGYLLRAAVKSNQYHTLYLSLINNADSSVVLQHKFLIEKGISLGSLTLPDSLPGGRYRFVANTNMKVNGNFDGEFIQAVTIKSSTVNPIIANVSIFKVFDEKTKNGTALLKLLSSENRFVENAEISYKIGKEDNILKSGKAKSSVIGELMIHYPADQITIKNNQLSISIKKDKDIRNVNFNLPVRNYKKYNLTFYPEGGYLVDGLVNKVGLEIKDGNNKAVNGKAILFANDVAIDTISTNSLGIGSFIVQPQKTKKYYAKIIDSQNEGLKYDFPAILSAGFALRLSSSIANDDLKVRVESNLNSKANIIVHDFSTIHLQSSFNFIANTPINIRFKLDSLPIGLYAVTVLDEDYKPVSERIFFAHYDEINKILVNTDKEEYETRDSLTVNLKVIGKGGKSSAGLVSVSCVQGNRLSFNNNQNITDFYFFERVLTDLPYHPQGIKSIDKDYLDNILLVKGWRKYKWPTQSIPYNPINSSSMEYVGTVSKNNRKLKVPVQLTTVGGTNINTIRTDSSGSFAMAEENLLSTDEDKVWLTLNDKKYYNYEINLTDPMVEVKKHLIRQEYKIPVNDVKQIEDPNLNIAATSGIRLKEVIIKSANDNHLDFAKKGANKCGDYVCKYGILNCSNHVVDADNMPPENGKRYQIPGGGTSIYAGCTDYDDKPNLRIIKGIGLAKEFYESDVSNMNEPINFATTYWNYQVAVKEKEDTKLTFHVGDITGPFKIVVQGITTNGVAYGEKEINVFRKTKSP